MLTDEAVVILDLDEKMLDLASALNPQDHRLKQCRRLVKRKAGSGNAAKQNRRLVLAYEILLATPAVRSMIRKGKLEAMPNNVIEMSRNDCMVLVGNLPPRTLRARNHRLRYRHSPRREPGTHQELSEWPAKFLSARPPHSHNLPIWDLSVPRTNFGGNETCAPTRQNIQVSSQARLEECLR